MKETGPANPTLAAVDAVRTLAERTLAITGVLTGADNTITEGLREPINVYHHTFKTKLVKTPEFAKKGLCTHQAPIELSCGHQCLCCSIRAVHSSLTSIQPSGRFPSMKALIQTGSCVSACGHAQAGGRGARAPEKRFLINPCGRLWRPREDER